MLKLGNWQQFKVERGRKVTPHDGMLKAKMKLKKLPSLIILPECKVYIFVLC